MIRSYCYKSSIHFNPLNFMNEYCFTVTKTGYMHVEADSFEDAEARLQENFGHLYVITETGEELSNGWETTGEVEEDPE